MCVYVGGSLSEESDEGQKEEGGKTGKSGQTAGDDQEDVFQLCELRMRP
jgi:hypothetical protein